MEQGGLKNQIENILKKADIQLDGHRPWDLKVHDERFYSRLLADGSLGLGESYVEGWWDCERIDEFIFRIGRADIQSKPNLKLAWHKVKSLVFNLQTKARSKIVGKKHYDIGNDLFIKMLDKRLSYSCAYWDNANSLDTAQEAKLDLICRKINLKPGMKVLDIGCGWGSFAKFAAERYHAHVVGITISKEQLDYAKQICQGLPLELRFQDYRDVNESFDRVVSIGQMEHVGYKNYSSFMKVVHRCLNEDGLFLLHTIGGNFTCADSDPWIDKYIFPNGKIPSMKQIAQASEKLFVMEDWHNLNINYDKTLMAWYQNFYDFHKTQKHTYDDNFFRLWKYYLLSCAGAFRARNLQLWQIIFSKGGLLGGYKSIR